MDKIVYYWNVLGAYKWILAAIVGLIFAVILLTPKKKKKSRKKRSKGIDYEYKVAKYLRRHGFYDVEVTKASGDYGIDIVARKGFFDKYAIQCKQYSNPVGVSAVQEAVAGKAVYNCNVAMVVTNSTYTKAAIKLARENNVILKSRICRF